MTEPGRLFDESESELERLLLGVARSEKSSPEARARTLAALGVTSSAALSAAALTAAATPAATPTMIAGKAVWAKLMLGLSALGAVAIAPPVYRAWQRRQAAVATVATAPAAPAATLPAAPATLPPVASTAAVRPGATTLARELGALDAVRTAVARGQARLALARLDAYARDYPDGRLALEAEILRIDALARSGDPAGARRRAEAFLRRHPRSALAARARRYLGD